MAGAIEGKVAKILDEYTLVISVGQANGVRPGMTFIVCAKGDEVADPDTGESLGQWEAVKGHIVVTHVQEKLAICNAASPKDDDDDTDPTTRTLSAAMVADHMRQQRSAGALNVNKSQIEGMPKTGPISVGDSVRSVHA